MSRFNDDSSIQKLLNYLEQTKLLEKIQLDIEDTSDSVWIDILDSLWLGLQIKKFKPDENSPDLSKIDESQLKVISANRENKQKKDRKLKTPEIHNPGKATISVKEGKQHEKDQRLDVISNNPVTKHPENLTYTIPMKVPAAPAILNFRSLGQALQPLKRKIPSRCYKNFIDEEATVNEIAANDLWMPVIKSDIEKWLSLELVLEESDSSFIWEELEQNLQKLLEALRVFKTIRVWKISSSERKSVVADFEYNFYFLAIAKLLHDQYFGLLDFYFHTLIQQRRKSLLLVRQKKRQRKLIKPINHKHKELVHSNGRGLVLLVSDCVSPLWENIEIYKCLKDWSKNQPTAIIQLFPENLWDSTMLGRGRKVFASTLAPCVSNPKLRLKDYPSWLPIDWKKCLLVPIITLQPSFLHLWSSVIRGSSLVEIPAILFDLDFIEEVLKQKKSTDVNKIVNPENILNKFFAIASQPAKELAKVMAYFPVDMSVINLVRKSFLNQVEPVHIAEFYMSGLLKIVGGINDKRYDFIPEVREILQDIYGKSKAITALDSISDYVTANLGYTVKTFQALITNITNLENLNAEYISRILPFAKIGLDILRSNGSSNEFWVKEKYNLIHSDHYKKLIKLTENFTNQSKFPDTLSKLLQECTDAGKDISDDSTRAGYQRLAKDIGDAIFKVSGKYPEMEIHPYVNTILEADSKLLCNLPSCDKFFIGRRIQLQNLSEQLSRHFKVLIYGLSGMGKTPIALRYACKSIDDEHDNYKYIFWVNANSNKIESSFSKIARSLNLQSQFRDSIKDVLEKIDEKWLLIFDGADDSENIDEYIPNCSSNHHILITSRNKKIVDSISDEQSIYLREMNKEEAEDFLVSRTGLERNIFTKRIAKSLGFFPLALEQSCAYIINNRISFEEYWNRYSNKKSQGEPLHLINIAITWDLTFETIKQINSLSAELLYLISYLCSDQIPKKLLEKSFEFINISNFEFDEVMNPLLQYNIVSYNDTSNCYSIHELVQEIIKANSQEHRYNQVWKITEIMNKVFPPDLTEQDLLEQLLPHAQAISGWLVKCNVNIPESVELLENVSIYTRRYGNIKKAEEMLKNAIKIQERLGDDSSDNYNASLYNNIGRIYFLLGKYELAGNQYKKALNIIQNDSDKATLLAHLGSLKRELGKFKEAEENYEEALNLSKRIYGNNSLEVAKILDSHANLYYQLGKYDEAGQKFLESVAIYQSLGLISHPSLAKRYSNLGLLHRAMGRYKDAESYFLNAKKIYDDVYDGSHPEKAINLNYYAYLYYAQAKFEKAEIMYLEALKMTKLVFGGENHPEVAYIYNNIALLYKSMGEYYLTDVYLKKALKITEAVFKENGKHPRIARIFNDQAQMLSTKNKPEKARELFENALEINTSKLGDKHPYVANNLNNLARIYVDLGDFEEAEWRYKKSLEMRRSLFGNNHPEVANTLHNLAEMYRQQSHLDEAESFYVESLSLRRAFFSDGHPDIAQSLYGYSLLLIAKERKNEAVNNLLEAFAIYMDFFEISHPSISNVMTELFSIEFEDTKNIDKLANIFFDNLEYILEKSRTLKIFEIKVLWMSVANEILNKSLSENSIIACYPLVNLKCNEYTIAQQFKLLIVPIVKELKRHLRTKVREYLISYLSEIQNTELAQTYAPGNIINLLIQSEKGILKDLNLSGLSLRHVDFRNVATQNLNCSDAEFSDCLFCHPQPSMVLSVAFSPDGKIIVTGEADGYVRLRDIDSGQLLVHFAKPIRAWIWAVSFSPDGKYIASSGDDHLIYLWDANARSLDPYGVEPNRVFGLIAFETHTDSVRSLDFHPSGKILASGSGDHKIMLWNVETAQRLRVLVGHQQSVRSVKFSPDGKLLASGSVDGTVKVWEVETGRLLFSSEMQRKADGSADHIRTVAFSPDGKCLASGHDSGRIWLWDLENFQKNEQILEGHTNWVFSVTFNPEEPKLLASAGEDGTIRLWNVKTRKCEKILEGHRSSIRSIRFSPNGQLLASGSVDFSVRLWEIPRGRCTKIIQGYTNWVWSAVFSPDGNLLASGHGDQKVRVWQVKTRQLVLELAGHKDVVRSVCFSPDGKLLASGSSDRTICLWDLDQETGQFLEKHNSWVRSVAFSPDGRLLASGSDDTTINIWDVATRDCIKTLVGHTDPVRSVTFHPQGKLLASGSGDGTVKIWDVETGECLNGDTMRHWDEYTQGKDWVWSVCFSPDGHYLASGGGDKMVRIWAIDVQRLEFHAYHAFSDEAPVRAVAFSPDGYVVACGGVDCGVRRWNLQTGESLPVLAGHTHTVRTIAFNAQGEGLYLASGSQDGTIKFWDLNRGGESKPSLQVSFPYQGMNINNAKGLDEFLRRDLISLGAITN